MKKYFAKIITHPLFSGSAIMVIGSNSINVLNYVYHFAMGKLLTPPNYGELVSLISLMGLLGIIPSSFSLVIVKYVSAAKSEGETTALINWLKDRVLKLSLILFVLITLSAPIIASFLHVTRTAYIILIAITFLFSLTALLNRSILQGLLKFKEMISTLLVENTVKLFTGVILVYVGLQVGGALIGFMLATIVGFYLTNFYLKYPKINNPILPNIRPIINYTLPVIIQSFAITSLYSSDIILVRHFFSSHDAGIYAALSTLGKIIFFGAGPIGSVMFPLVSQHHSRGKNYEKIFNYSLLATTLFASILLFIYWRLPSFVITLLYNYSYLEAKNLLVWFGIFITLFTLSSLLLNYSLSLGKTRVVFLPLIAAIAQIALICFFHQDLFTVILISIAVTALLLLSLLIYSYSKDGNQVDLGDSSSI